MGGTGHYIGTNGTVTNNVHSDTAKIRALLQELMDAMPAVSMQAEDEAGQLTDELRNGHVDGGRIRSFLRDMTAAAGSVTAVSDAAARLTHAIQMH